jgi:hypothetical protein
MTKDGVDSSQFSRVLSAEEIAAASSGESTASAPPAPEAYVDAKYYKYLNLVRAGIPKGPVAMKMVTEGVCANKEEAFDILNNSSVIPGDPSNQWYSSSKVASSTPAPTSSSNPPSTGAVSSGGNVAVPLKDHPQYAKYFKMIKAGLPEISVKAKMQQEGIDPSILKRDQNEIVLIAVPAGAVGAAPAQPEPARPSESAPATATAAAATGEVPKDAAKPDEPPAPTAPESVSLMNDPKYGKYFKLLKMGMPREGIEAKMRAEGLDPSLLDKNPTDPAPPASATPNLTIDTSSAETVAVQDHPKYSKFFKMLKVGLPKSMVKTKMEQEGLDPSFIDKDPEEKVPVNDSPPEGAGAEMVAVQDHPKYSKFFKMLKVGLPKSMVKTKVEQEGLDPSMMDKDPEEKIPLNDAVQPAQQVAVQDHPKYSKFFKMLKVGLPKSMVKTKMEQEGLDPSFIDKDPEEKIPAEERDPGTPTPKLPSPKKSPSPIKKLPQIRKKKLHWKAIENVSADSVWATGNDEDDDMFKLDKDEFEELFTEKGYDLLLCILRIFLILMFMF